MKTTATMKNDFFEFLSSLGLVLNYAINGLIGGTIWSIYKKSKFWEAVRQIVIGGVVAGYLTPVVVAKTSMSLEVISCTSFVIGMTGMVIVDSVYKYCAKKFKDWKDALIIINSKK